MDPINDVNYDFDDLRKVYKYDVFTLLLSLVKTPFNVIYITQQIGNKRASSNFFSTLSCILEKEGKKGLTKSLFTQYIIDLLHYRFFTLFQNIKYTNHIPYGIVLLLGNFVLYPLKVARTRLIQQRVNLRYKGVFDCLFKMIQEDDTIPLFNGAILDTLNLLLSISLRNFFNRLITDKISGLLPDHLKIFSLIPSELLQSLVTYPISTIIAKVQAQIPNGKTSIDYDIKADNTFDCIQKVVQKKGLFSLYSGYFGYCLKSITKYLTIFIFTNSISHIRTLKSSFLNRYKDYIRIPYIYQ